MSTERDRLVIEYPKGVPMGRVLLEFERVCRAYGLRMDSRSMAVPRGTYVEAIPTYKPQQESAA